MGCAVAYLSRSPFIQTVIMSAATALICSPGPRRWRPLEVPHSTTIRSGSKNLCPSLAQELDMFLAVPAMVRLLFAPKMRRHGNERRQRSPRETREGVLDHDQPAGDA